MNIELRESRQTDIPFMREMFYEAVYWLPNPKKLSLEEGTTAPGVSVALSEWGKRDGDTAVIAIADSTPAGAAWYRFYTDDNYIRGYIEESTPVLVIVVHKDFRRLGNGHSKSEPHGFKG